MLPPADPPITAFPATERMLRTALADAVLDAASFERRLAPCALAACGGTCCAHGATLNGEEALVLRQIARRNEGFLRALVPDLPERAIVREDGVERTAVKPRAMHGRISGYPGHFPETACAFLLEDARCALQCLAEHEGKHPWTYKPLACWLHPIALSAGRIELPDEETDRHAGGFATATHCGRTAACGRPAREVLAAELEHLGRLLGRDLHAEKSGTTG